MPTRSVAIEPIDPVIVQGWLAKLADMVPADARLTGFIVLKPNDGEDPYVVYAQLLRDDDDEPAEDSHVQYCAETADEHGFTASVWSIGRTMFGEPHPYPGATLLQYDGTGDVNGIHVAINGPLWLDLWKAADLALGRSADKAHRYIEGFEPDEEDPKTLHLMTGS
jgi:hypothetical protein